MPQITYQSQVFSLDEGESVLACLTRNGIAVPSSCQAGACQSCMMRAVEGTPPPAAQQGLKDALRQQGYFLSCVAKPDSDLQVALPEDAAVQVAAVVSELDLLASDVLRVRLIPEAPFAYQGGQFLNVVREDGVIRPYSIASLPDQDPFIELHVRRTPNGNMSNWMHDELRIGQRLHLRGPAGDCFHIPGSPDQPLLLVGTGTGLAPLYAVLRDALRHGHTGPISLYHGALREDGFYLVDELAEVAREQANVSYNRCMPEGEPGPGLEIGLLDRIVLSRVGKPTGWRCYLCGNPTLVHDLRKKLFLAGASMKQIHSDAFITAPK